MDYKNGKIYTIRSHQTDLFYIGSTCSPLSKRLYEHKCGYINYLKGNYRCVSSFNILKYDDAYIELLEEFPCENKLQLRKREGELIRLNNCVNRRIECRTHQEYCQENKDKIAEYQKKYNQENKDKIAEYKKGYYQENKDKKSDYYQENKDKIADYKKEKITCECGCLINRNNILRHQKTQKHLNLMEKK